MLEAKNKPFMEHGEEWNLLREFSNLKSETWVAS